MSGEIKESHLGMDEIQRLALFSISLYYQVERESFQTRKHRYVKLVRVQTPTETAGSGCIS